MTNQTRRPGPSPAMLERAIEANQRVLAEHRRAAGRTLTDAQAEGIAESLYRQMTTPGPVVESRVQARHRRLAEAAEVTPPLPLHRMQPAALTRHAAGVWHAVIGPAAY